MQVISSLIVTNVHSLIIELHALLIFFFFNDTATTEIYTLSLHDALPISITRARGGAPRRTRPSRASRSTRPPCPRCAPGADRKSTRLNSSHDQISYAVFCLKKKKRTNSCFLCRSGDRILPRR